MIAPTLPNADELKPFLAKLESNPGSIVIVALSWNREIENFARCQVGHFSADARKRLRRALQGEKRRAANP